MRTTTTATLPPPGRRQAPQREAAAKATRAEFLGPRTANASVPARAPIQHPAPRGTHAQAGHDRRSTPSADTSGTCVFDGRVGLVEMTPSARGGAGGRQSSQDPARPPKARRP